MALVSIKNLHVDTTIGIYEHEQEKPQPLFFDLDMHADIKAAAKNDSISDALDYAVVAEHIETLVKANQKKLLESLIVYIADQLLENFPNIEKLTLTVRKPNALDAADCSQIVYEASRHANN